jgi:bifunctional non-homologous end joining protein LigD
MGLAKYNRKRNFKITSEPSGKLDRHKATKPIFVIQEHHATRLHWDFRLEADGVLKSWAVTKEPTLDPSIKRLAVQVEDHPLPYAKFHGQIPAGQYGAGQVEIWDKGTYDNLEAKRPLKPRDVSTAIEHGKIEVELHGKKLKGAYALVRMGGTAGGDRRQNWLLIKKRDQYAKEDGSQKTQDRSQKSEDRSQKKNHPTFTGRRPRGLASPLAASSSSRSTKSSRHSSTNTDSVHFTHVEKVMFPSGVTKGDILNYYLQISPALLPHLKDRPVNVKRFPDGVTENSPRFWQKNTPSYYPDWIQRIGLKNEAGKTVEYSLINDERALMYFVNQGALTFHTYFSTIAHLDHPDFVLFDLDPGQADFADVVTIAKKLHDLLGDDAFVKTSGKSGLHIMVKWTGEGGFNEARAWATTIAEQVVAALPKIATMQRSKSERKGRVYVDVMQNAQGKHVVPPYVLRATPAATVSMPLDWREITARLSPKKSDMKAALKRVKAKGDLWKNLLS